MKREKTELHILWAFLMSFLVTGLYFFLVYRRLPFLYDINDDVAMRNVAAGVITGEPDAHLLHIKYVLGLLISSLYRFFPGLDWYGLVLIGIVLFAFSMVLYRGLAAKEKIFWKLCYTAFALLLFTCLGLQHISAFQWTVTAAASGAAGLYLFYTAEDEDSFQVRLEEGISVFLILLSLAVRDDVFLIILPLAALCYWWKYGDFHRKERPRISLRRLSVPAGLILGAAVILGTEAFAYRSPEWKEFRTYNVEREAIMDYYGLQTYEEDPACYDSLSISREEAENLQRYSLYLVDGLYSEKMAALAQRSKEVYLNQHSFLGRVKKAVRSALEHLGKDTYHWSNALCLAMMALALFQCFWKDRRQLLLLLCILFIWAACWFYLGYRNRILERVGFALYLAGFLTSLAVWYRVSFQGQGERRSPYGTAAALCVGAALVLLSGRVWKLVEGNNQWRWNYNLEFLDVNRYMAERPENVYFMTTFSIETYTDNFTIQRDFDFSNLLSVGGWHTFSPVENEKCKKLGITDPKRDIAEKDNIYVISLANVNLRYMDRYYTSLYGEKYLGRALTDSLDYGERVFEVYDFEVER